MKIAFVGFGEIVKALISGIRCSNNDLSITAFVRSCEKNLEKSKDLNVILRDIVNIKDEINEFDIVVLAVPYIALDEIDFKLCNDTLLVSLLSDERIYDRATKYIDISPLNFVRALPNIMVTVADGIILVDEIYNGENNIFKEIFEKTGKIFKVKRDLFKVTEALAACSAVFVSSFVESLSDAAVSSGLSRGDSYKIIYSMLSGSSKMMANNLHPAEFKDMICSPGGISIKGYNYIEAKSLQSILKEGFWQILT